jgi:hypothetical protein
MKPSNLQPGVTDAMIERRFGDDTKESPEKREFYASTIPLGRLAWCGECELAFNVLNKACPKCGTTCGWAIIPFGKTDQFLAEVERRAGASREEILKSSERWPFSAQAMLRRILGEKP